MAPTLGRKPRPPPRGDGTQDLQEEDSVPSEPARSRLEPNPTALQEPPDEKLGLPISVLELSPRVGGILEESGIVTIGALARLHEYEVLRIKGFGVSGLKETRDRLLDMGVSFGAKAPGPKPPEPAPKPKTVQAAPVPQEKKVPKPPKMAIVQVPKKATAPKASKPKAQPHKAHKPESPAKPKTNFKLEMTEEEVRAALVKKAQSMEEAPKAAFPAPPSEPETTGVSKPPKEATSPASAPETQGKALPQGVDGPKGAGKVEKGAKEEVQEAGPPKSQDRLATQEAIGKQVQEAGLPKSQDLRLATKQAIPNKAPALTDNNSIDLGAGFRIGCSPGSGYATFIATVAKRGDFAGVAKDLRDGKIDPSDKVQADALLARMFVPMDRLPGWCKQQASWKRHSEALTSRLLRDAKGKDERRRKAAQSVLKNPRRCGKSGAWEGDIPEIVSTCVGYYNYLYARDPRTKKLNRNATKFQRAKILFRRFPLEDRARPSFVLMFPEEYAETVRTAILSSRGVREKGD